MFIQNTKNNDLNAAIQFGENLVTMAENGILGEKNVKPAMLFMLSLLTNIQLEPTPVWNKLRVVKAMKDETGCSLLAGVKAADKIKEILGFPQN